MDKKKSIQSALNRLNNEVVVWNNEDILSILKSKLVYNDYISVEKLLNKNENMIKTISEYIMNEINKEV